MILLHRISVVLDRIVLGGALFSTALILLLMLGVVANVSSRSFGHPIMGMEEVSEYFILWMTFAGAAWVLKRGKHVRIDVFVVYLNPRAQAILYAVLLVITAVIFGFIVWTGAIYSYASIRDNVYLPQVLRPNRGIVWAIIPAGSLLLVIQLLKNAYEGFRFKKGGTT